MGGLTLYAAAVATLALGWNVVSWALGNLTRVRVFIEPTTLLLGPESVAGENLTIHARNLSAHPIQTVSSSFEILGPPRRQIHLVPTPHFSKGIPGVIPARSMASRWMAREDAEFGGLIGVPIRAYVQMAHRERPYYSKAVTVEHNAWDAPRTLGPIPYRVISPPEQG